MCFYLWTFYTFKKSTFSIVLVYERWIYTNSSLKYNIKIFFAIRSLHVSFNWIKTALKLDLLFNVVLAHYDTCCPLLNYYRKTEICLELLKLQWSMLQAFHKYARRPLICLLLSFDWQYWIDWDHRRVFMKIIIIIIAAAKFWRSHA